MPTPDSFPRCPQVAGYVLAGGASTRMGRNKALLAFEGELLIVRAARLLSEAGLDAKIVGPPALYAPLGLATVEDLEPGLGPLGGIATALADSSRDWILAIAVDLPYLTPAWLSALAARSLRAGPPSAPDAILPRSDRSLEPLSALYHRRLAGPIRQALDRGVRKITDALAGCRVEEIPPAEWKPFAPEGLLFENINTPADYARAAAGDRK